MYSCRSDLTFFLHDGHACRAFGVTMWEIVMMGAVPYPGVPPMQLFTLLCKGQRMAKPENCSDSLYKV